MRKCIKCGGEYVLEKDGKYRCNCCGSEPDISQDGTLQSVTYLNIAYSNFENREFDIAEAAFRSAVRCRESKEAYLGILLCKCGIEFVRTDKDVFVPVFHRVFATDLRLTNEYYSYRRISEGGKRESAESETIDTIDEQRAQIVKRVQEGKTSEVVLAQLGDATDETRRILTKIETELKKSDVQVYVSRETSAENEVENFGALYYADAMILLCDGKETNARNNNIWQRFLRFKGKENNLIPLFAADFDKYSVPEKLKTYLLNGVSVMEMGAVEKIFEKIEKVLGRRIRRTTDEEIALYQKALLTFEANNYEKASEICMEYILKNKEDWRGWDLMLRIHTKDFSDFEATENEKNVERILQKMPLALRERKRFEYENYFRKKEAYLKEKCGKTEEGRSGYPTEKAFVEVFPARPPLSPVAPIAPLTEEQKNRIEEDLKKVRADRYLTGRMSFFACGAEATGIRYSGFDLLSMKNMNGFFTVTKG